VDFWADWGKPISIEPGETEAHLRVLIDGDDEPERNEVFAVRLAPNRDGVPVPGLAGLVWVVIVDDDTRVLTSEPVEVTESTGPVQATLELALSQPAWEPVVVRWSTLSTGGALAGEAEPGADYVHAGGTVTFDVGESRASVAVTVLPDGLAEDDEVVLVSFAFVSPAYPGVRMGDPWGLGVVRIHDG
jgi:hypothetical protein